MSYLRTAKNRRLKYKINKVLSLFRFKYFSFNFYTKLIFVWSLISIFSLFIPWAKVNTSFLILAFSNTLWNVWYFMLLIQVLILFFLLSNRFKENIKVNISLHLKDKYIVFYMALFLLVLSILSLRILIGISHFYENIIYLNWIIFSIIWNIIMVIWSYLENKNTIKDSIVNINNSWVITEETQLNTEKNMKLPF